MRSPFSMARRMRALAKALAPDTAVTYGGNNGAGWTGINSVVDVRGVPALKTVSAAGKAGLQEQ